MPTLAAVPSRRPGRPGRGPVWHDDRGGRPGRGQGAVCPLAPGLQFLRLHIDPQVRSREATDRQAVVGMETQTRGGQHVQAGLQRLAQISGQLKLELPVLQVSSNQESTGKTEVPWGIFSRRLSVLGVSSGR